MGKIAAVLCYYMHQRSTAHLIEGFSSVSQGNISVPEDFSLSRNIQEKPYSASCGFQGMYLLHTQNLANFQDSFLKEYKHLPYAMLNLAEFSIFLEEATALHTFTISENIY
jgi:hypothetical protein